MGELIQIVVPTYRRTQNIHATYMQLKGLPGTRLLFVAHEHDISTRDYLEEHKLPYVLDTQPASGVNATNCGFWNATTDWVVIGQDDFRWHDGWLDEAKRVRAETGAKVIGFNDGFAGRNEHSVGWLVDRQYVQANSLCSGFPNVIFNPHYKKNFSDDELNNTAKYRGVWAYADQALLEHLHPTFNKAKSDETYERLDKFFEQDYELYNARKHLWGQ